MSNLISYAEEEMRRAGLYDDDADYGGMIPDAVIAIVAEFASQGHSGASAAAVTSIVEKVMRFEPLTPLTYEPDEWINVSNMSDEPMWQNRRKSDVFSTDEGATWYCLDGTEGTRSKGGVVI